jgi:hypothetical protein
LQKSSITGRSRPAYQCHRWADLAQLLHRLADAVALLLGDQVGVVGQEALVEQGAELWHSLKKRRDSNPVLMGMHSPSHLAIMDDG